jgi:hypothetical protein
VPHQTRKYPVGVHRRYTRHVPLVDLLRDRVN